MYDPQTKFRGKLYARPYPNRWHQQLMDDFWKQKK
jgi:hypothetical protein